MLIFGWMGFNPGSTFGATDLRIAVVAVNTLLAASAGAVVAMAWTNAKWGKPDISMTCNGMLAGLVAITAPCAFVAPWASIVIGMIAGFLVCYSVGWFDNVFKIDDPCGAISVHGMCGLWGVLAVGLFADGTYGAGWNGVAGTVKGLFYGDGGQLVAQVIDGVVGFIWAWGVTYLIFIVLRRWVKLRVDARRSRSPGSTRPSSASSATRTSSSACRDRPRSDARARRSQQRAPAGAKHILIDCGVHSKDIKSIRDAVTQMAKDCDSHLSLVIMTHRHADHISGFGTCSDIFSDITVDRVWMPWFEDRKNNDAKAIQAGFTTLATRLTARLAARGGRASDQLAMMAENITGGIDAMGIAANQKALDVLHYGFKNKPEHDYYHAGDPAKLPDDLVAAGLSAQILGPPSDPALIKQMTYKAQQYLAGDRDSDDTAITPFAAAFRANNTDYPPSAFRFHSAKKITTILQDAQPDMLKAQALAADNTLNNQKSCRAVQLRRKEPAVCGRCTVGQLGALPLWRRVRHVWPHGDNQ